MSNPQDLELFHYGVKGMKWGVIRSKASKKLADKKRESEESAKQKAKDVSNPTSKEAKTAKSNRKRVETFGTDVLTNKELKAVVNRMNLEQQYSNLVENQKSASRRRGVRGDIIDFGKGFVSDVMKDAGKYAMGEAFKYGAQKYAGRRSSRYGYSSANRPPAIGGRNPKQIGS